MTREEKIAGLYERGAHIGFSRSKRNSSMKSMIFGVKSRIDIIDLNKTVDQIEEATNLLRDIVSRGKGIVVVGTKPEVKIATQRLADALRGAFVTKRWIGGTLTNFNEIQGRVKKLETFLEKKVSNSLVYQTKKELLMLEREAEKLEANFGGLKSMKELPGLMIVIDPRHEDIAITEAKTKRIPIIALMGTDCNLNDADAPIVANDTLLTSVNYILDLLREGSQR
jgi:small subunit ribosomal protein S2